MNFREIRVSGYQYPSPAKAAHTIDSARESQVPLLRQAQKGDAEALFGLAAIAQTNAFCLGRHKPYTPNKRFAIYLYSRILKSSASAFSLRDEMRAGEEIAKLAESGLSEQTLAFHTETMRLARSTCDLL